MWALTWEIALKTKSVFSHIFTYIQDLEWMCLFQTIPRFLGRLLLFACALIHITKSQTRTTSEMSSNSCSLLNFVKFLSRTAHVIYCRDSCLGLRQSSKKHVDSVTSLGTKWIHLLSTTLALAQPCSREVCGVWLTALPFTKSWDDCFHV